MRKLLTMVLLLVSPYVFAADEIYTGFLAVRRSMATIPSRISLLGSQLKEQEIQHRVQRGGLVFLF